MSDGQRAQSNIPAAHIGDYGSGALPTAPAHMVTRAVEYVVTERGQGGLSTTPMPQSNMMIIIGAHCSYSCFVCHPQIVS